MKSNRTRRTALNHDNQTRTAIFRLPDFRAATQIKYYRQKLGPAASAELAAEYVRRCNSGSNPFSKVAFEYGLSIAMIAESHIAKGDLNLAADIFKAGLQTTPKNSVLWRGLAKVELRRGRGQRRQFGNLVAEDCAAKAVSCNPHDMRAAALYADILRMNGNLQAAFDFLYPVANRRFDHNVMLALCRIAANDFGGVEYKRLVDRYYANGEIAQIEQYSVRRHAAGADRAELQQGRIKLDKRGLLPRSYEIPPSVNQPDSRQRRR